MLSKLQYIYLTLKSEQLWYTKFIQIPIRTNKQYKHNILSYHDVELYYLICSSSLVRMHAVFYRFYQPFIDLINFLSLLRGAHFLKP